MRKGFSLIEVMIAAAIMGVLTLAMMKMVDMQNSASITAQTRFDENEIYTIFERTIASSKSCNHTLGGWCSSNGAFIDIDRPECIVTGKVWNIGAVLGNHQSQVAISNLKDTNRNTTLAVGSDYGRVKLTGITLKTVAPADGGAPQDGIGNLELSITTTRTNSKFIGAKTNTKKILAYVKRDPDGSVYKCYTAGFEDVIPRERVYIMIEQTTSTPIIEGGVEVAVRYTASCDAGDMMLGGDCIVKLFGPSQNLVFGDGDLIINGAPSCGGCPNNQPCDAACFDNSYSGYSCVYNHKIDYEIKWQDGTTHPLGTAMPANSTVIKKYIPFETANGLGSGIAGARALCLDRY